MPPKSRAERLFGAACLKLALDRTSGPTEIYRETLVDLGLTEEDVEAYLTEHREAVQVALDSRGQPKN